MSPLSFISLLIILSLYSFHSISSNHHNLIQQVCKNVSKTDPNISFKFCTTSLQADPGSHCAQNLREVGLITMKLLRHNVTDTRVHIKELLTKKKGFDPLIKECLDDCLQVYSDAIPTLGNAIRDYKAKRYADSNIKVSSVLDAPTTCEDGFKERNGVVSPLKKRNNDAFQLAAIALSIINMLNK